MGNDLLIDGDGEDSLDFTYIDDLLQVLKKIINSKNSINQTFNITYGKASKINFLKDIILEKYPKIKFNYQNRDKLIPEREP